MTTSAQLAAYLDDLLEVRQTPDYPNALNGLQLENHGEITKIATAVDFSSQTIAGTISGGANCLIVHHGMFWAGLQPIYGSNYTRLKTLIDHNIAVYSVHLPLDRHPIYGNNTLLAQQLGLVPSGDFATFKTIAIGVRGSTDVETQELATRAHHFAQSYGGILRTTTITPGQRTRRWAICTGSGASVETLREASQHGVDTLIVGEGPHHTAVDAAELGITILYAGHYATETLGVRALGVHLLDRFAIPWTFIDIPTGL